LAGSFWAVTIANATDSTSILTAYNSLTTQLAGLLSTVRQVRSYSCQRMCWRRSCSSTAVHAR
jgi:hypothetical protein